MAKRNNSDLFFTCSLVEYIGREKKLQRKDVVNQIGKDGIEGIYDSADVLHCEPIAKIADEVIRDFQVSQGEFDNVALCEYQVPDYWTIGEVYERLIEDVFNEDQIVDGIMECIIHGLMR
jgi:hypothetical protein